MNQGFGIEAPAGSLIISVSRFYGTGHPVQTAHSRLYESLSKKMLDRKPDSASSIETVCPVVDDDLWRDIHGRMTV
jgi:hypothetical protein